jgi:hypothetical protein
MPRSYPSRDAEASGRKGKSGIRFARRTAGAHGLPSESLNRPPAAQMTPISSAFSTARVRSRTPSFDRTLEVWFLTVPAAVPDASAIPRFEEPAAIRRRISHFSGRELVRQLGALEGGGLPAPCQEGRAVSRAGRIREPPSANGLTVASSWRREMSFKRTPLRPAAPPQGPRNARQTRSAVSLPPRETAGLPRVEP